MNSSIRVGTIGTISSLMTMELDSLKYTKSATRRTYSPPPSSVAAVSLPGRLAPSMNSKLLNNEAKNSTIHRKNTTKNDKPRHSSHARIKNDQRIPMLECEDAASVRRKKTYKKAVPHIVEIVDVKCRNPEKAWSTPLTSKLKRLRFAKLSETVG